MPHLDFVALREPVTCTLPTDEPGRKRLVRQFRRLELELYEQARAYSAVRDDVAALLIYDDLCKYAVEGITDAELNTLAVVDKVRLLGAAQGKLEIIEAALGNAHSGGDDSSPMEPPPPATPDSTPTTPEAPPPAA
jgi:hypothetical protein